MFKNEFLYNAVNKGFFLKKKEKVLKKIWFEAKKDFLVFNRGERTEQLGLPVVSTEWSQAPTQTH